MSQSLTMRSPYQIVDSPDLKQALSYVYSMLTQKVQARRAQQAGVGGSDSSDSSGSDRKSSDGAPVGDPIAYISKPKGAYREYAGQTLMLLISTRRSGSRNDPCAQPYYNVSSVLALADMAAAYQDELLSRHENFPANKPLADFVNADIIHCFSEQASLTQFSQRYAASLSDFFVGLDQQAAPQITQKAVEALFTLLQSLWNFMNEVDGPVASAKAQEQAWSRDFAGRLEDAVGAPLHERFGIREMSSFIERLGDDWLLRLRDKCLRDPSFSSFNCWVSDSRDYVARHVPEQGQFSSELQLFRLLGSMLTLAFERRVFELLQEQKHLVVYDGSSLNMFKGLLQKCSLSAVDLIPEKAVAQVLGRADGSHLRAFLPAPAQEASRSGSDSDEASSSPPSSPEGAAAEPSEKPQPFSLQLSDVLILKYRDSGAAIERVKQELEKGECVIIGNALICPKALQANKDWCESIQAELKETNGDCEMLFVSPNPRGFAKLSKFINDYFAKNPPTPPRDSSPAPVVPSRRRGSASDLSVVVSGNSQQVFAEATVAANTVLSPPPARSPTARVGGSG